VDVRCGAAFFRTILSQKDVGPDVVLQLSYSNENQSPESRKLIPDCYRSAIHLTCGRCYLTFTEIFLKRSATGDQPNQFRLPASTNSK